MKVYLVVDERFFGAGLNVVEAEIDGDVVEVEHTEDCGGWNTKARAWIRVCSVPPDAGSEINGGT